MNLARTTRLAALTAALAIVLTMGANAQNKPTLGGKLELDDEGSFFVNGQSVTLGVSRRFAPHGPRRRRATSSSTRCTCTSASRRRRKACRIVMVHGSNHTGMTYETTPDGREGWATWFVRQGHPVYVVDHSGRGRSGFNPTPINAVRDGGADPKALPTLFFGPIDRAWVELPLRAGISDAVPESPVPARSARPVSRAARAEHRDDAGRRRRQHGQRARRAARQDRPGDRHRALAVGRTTASSSCASGPKLVQGAHQRRRRLRDAHGGRRGEILPQRAVRLGVRRQQRGREGRSTATAPQRLHRRARS